jgi:teichuronic acid exporter
MENVFKKKVLQSFFWSIFGRLSYMIVGFIANVFLARNLGSEVYGVFGIIMFFTVISKVLLESGLSGYLVSKKNVEEKDYSTVFIFNLTISLVIYFFIFIFSGFISEYYNNPDLKLLLRISSIVVIVDSFRIVQNIKLVKKMDFKTKHLFELISISLSSIVAVVLMFQDFGIWSLIFMQLTSSIVLTLLLWVGQGSLSTYIFDVTSFKAMYKFGMNTTAAVFLNTVFDNIYQLVLAKYFTIQQTGLFFQAKKLEEVPTSLVKSTTMGVAYSALAELQDNLTSFYSLYERIVNILSVFMGAITMITFYYAEDILLLLYGKEWVESAFFLRVLSVAAFLGIQETMNRIIFKVFDKTEKIIRLELFKKSIQSITIVIGIIYSNLEFLIYGYLLTSVISFFINYYVSGKINNRLNKRRILDLMKITGTIVFLVFSANLINSFFYLNSIGNIILILYLTIGYFFLLHLGKVFDYINVLELIKKFKK